MSLGRRSALPHRRVRLSGLLAWCRRLTLRRGPRLRWTLKTPRTPPRLDETLIAPVGFTMLLGVLRGVMAVVWRIRRGYPSRRRRVPIPPARAAVGCVRGGRRRSDAGGTDFPHLDGEHLGVQYHPFVDVTPGVRRGCVLGVPLSRVRHDGALHVAPLRAGMGRVLGRRGGAICVLRRRLHGRVAPLEIGQLAGRLLDERPNPPPERLAVLAQAPSPPWRDSCTPGPRARCDCAQRPARRPCSTQRA